MQQGNATSTRLIKFTVFPGMSHLQFAKNTTAFTAIQVLQIGYFSFKTIYITRKESQRSLKQSGQVANTTTAVRCQYFNRPSAMSPAGQGDLAISQQTKMQTADILSHHTQPRNIAKRCVDSVKLDQNEKVSSKLDVCMCS